MRPDRKPSTLLLAAATIWAAALVGLALFGLGGRVVPHPDNAALAPALPTVSLSDAPSRLGAASEYLDVGLRPLLTLDRRPAAVTAEAGDGGSGDLDASLTSVMITPNLRLAMLQDSEGRNRKVKEGEVLQGTAWRLLQLQPRQAVFEGPSGQKTLQLRTYNGQGGAAPTPASTPAAANLTPPPAPVPGAPPPEVQRAIDAAVAATTPPPPAPEAESPQATQEEQIEAIRRRIEARRAQMREEAARAAAGQPPSQDK